MTARGVGLLLLGALAGCATQPPPPPSLVALPPERLVPDRLHLQALIGQPEACARLGVGAPQVITGAELQAWVETLARFGPALTLRVAVASATCTRPLLPANAAVALERYRRAAREWLEHPCPEHAQARGEAASALAREARDQRERTAGLVLLLPGMAFSQDEYHALAQTDALRACEALGQGDGAWDAPRIAALSALALEALLRPRWDLIETPDPALNFDRRYTPTPAVVAALRRAILLAIHDELEATKAGGPEATPPGQ